MKRTMDGHFHNPGSAADTVLVHRRHADPATLAITGMAARMTRLGADPVARVTELYEQGARHITLPEPVDLSSGADAGRAARTLVALREMTARTIAVDWQLRLGGPADADGDGREGVVPAVQPDAADGPDAHLDPAVSAGSPSTNLTTWRSSTRSRSRLERRACPRKSWRTSRRRTWWAGLGTSCGGSPTGSGAGRCPRWHCDRQLAEQWPLRVLT